ITASRTRAARSAAQAAEQSRMMGKMPTSRRAYFICSLLCFLKCLLLALQVTKHLGRDVAAADHRDKDFCFRQLIGVKQKSSNRNRAAGLSHRLGIRSQPAHGFVYFLLLDSDDVVDKTSNMLEVDLPDALSA